MLLLFTLMTHKTQVPLFVSYLDHAVERLRGQLLPPRRYTLLMLGDAVFRQESAAVSLGGLIFSSLPGMNQWSFVLAVSVVVDTVFVRSMLVPAVMGVLNQHNWWPLELPAVSIREARLDFDVE